MRSIARYRPAHAFVERRGDDPAVDGVLIAAVVFQGVQRHLDALAFHIKAGPQAGVVVLAADEAGLGIGQIANIVVGRAQVGLLFLRQTAPGDCMRCGRPSTPDTTLYCTQAGGET